MCTPRPRWRTGVALVPAAMAFAATVTACVSLDGLAGGGQGGDAGASGEEAGIRGDARALDDPSDPIQDGTSAAGDTGTPGDLVDGSAGDDSVDATHDSGPVDAGCTSDAGVPITLGAPAATSPAFGGSNLGTAFADTCGPGGALVGLNMVVDANDPFALFQIQAVCSTISLGTCSGALSFSPPAALTSHGTGTGNAETMRCPAGAVVIGLSAYAKNYVHSVTLTCARLVATASPTGTTWTLDAPTTVGPVGGSGGNPITPYQCPASSMVSAFSGTAGGEGFVDSIVMGCATPARR